MRVSGQKYFLKKSDADTIYWQGTEQITLKNNDTVIAIPQNISEYSY